MRILRIEKDEFGVYTIRVKIGKIVYTYVVPASYEIEKILRSKAYFGYRHLNKLKNLGRLVLKEIE